MYILILVQKKAFLTLFLFLRPILSENPQVISVLADILFQNEIPAIEQIEFVIIPRNTNTDIWLMFQS